MTNASTTWRIDAHRGAGPLRFGMTAMEVNLALGANGELLRRGDGGWARTENFAESGIQVDYDADGHCVAIQFTGGPTAPEYEGIAAMAVPYPELERQVQQRDPKLLLQHGGFVSMECGVGATASRIDDDSVRAQSFIAFAPGYYDDTLDALRTLARP